MDAIQSEIGAGRYAIACHNLDELLSWKSDPTGEIAFLLGYCERSRGDQRAAAAAWARVVPGSAFSRRAIEGRMRLFQESGQLAQAEAFLTSAALDSREDRSALLVLLVPMYAELGCFEEAEHLLEDRWEHLNRSGSGALEPAIKLVRQHIELTLRELPLDDVRRSLERAAKLAPDDDRVWLGRANLAVRMGAPDQALRWLDPCLRLRPNDLAVWRARLRAALAADRVDVVNQALSQLPATQTDPAPLHRAQAWLAVHRGDASAARSELELALASSPADLAALDQLAQLAASEGQTGRATELLRKTADINRLRSRYLQLHDRRQPIRNAAELARLAEQLGRPFEARVFDAIRAANMALAAHARIPPASETLLKNLCAIGAPFGNRDMTR
jgi:enediyne biosynthesis protein E4